MMIANEKKYKRLILKDPLKSVEFLVRYTQLELMPVGHNCQQPVLLYTNDCLNDYFELKTSGIHFTKGPQYTPQGLMAEFTDSRGNHYKMLEERSYESDQ